MVEKGYEWFDSHDAESDLLAPVRQLHDRDNWDVDAILQDTDARTSTTTLIEDSCVEMYETSKADVEKTISTLLADEDLSGFPLEFETNLRLASNAFKSWRSNRHATASRKAGTALQHTATTIGNFLQSFAGIAEMVKAADQQFGGLAYGTISILLSVAVQKQKREEAIEEALEELAHAFPRLETLRQIRPKESLRALIVDVFVLVVKFCRETVDYFAQRSHRLIKALSPLKLKTLNQLRVKLSEIKEECTIATLEELAETRRTLAEVQEQLKRIESIGDDTNIRVRQGHEWMQRSQSRSQNMELSEVRQALGLRTVEKRSTTEIISQYRKLLEDEFCSLEDESQNRHQMSWALLKTDKKFSQWLELDQSSLLLIGGDNYSDSSSLVLNWLSLASILVAEEELSSSFQLSYFCQTDYANSRSKRRSFSDVVRNLLYQLAEQHPRALQEWLKYIQDAISSPEWGSSDYSISFDAMAQLCIKILSLYQEEESFTVVIDRLDLCRWKDGPGANGLYQAVCALQDILRHKLLAHLRVKILLVMDGRPAQQIARLFGQPGRGISWKIDWDQLADDG